MGRAVGLLLGLATACASPADRTLLDPAADTGDLDTLDTDADTQDTDDSDPTDRSLGPVVLDDTATPEDTSPLSAATAPQTGLCSADGWCWVWPLPHGVQLRDVSGTSSTDLWAVGPPDIVQHWDGESMSLESVPGANGAVVFAAEDGTVCVSGDALRCREDGVWTIVPTPAGVGGAITGMGRDGSGHLWLLAANVHQQTETGWITHPVFGTHLSVFDDEVWLVASSLWSTPSLQRWDGTAWTTTPLSSTRITRVVRTADGTRWFLHDDELWSLPHDATTWLTSPAPGSGPVWDLAATPDGVVVLDSRDLWGLVDDVWTPLVAHDGGGGSLHVTSDGHLILAANDGGLLDLTDGRVEALHVPLEAPLTQLAPLPGGGVVAVGATMHRFVGAHHSTVEGPPRYPRTITARGRHVWALYEEVDTGVANNTSTLAVHTLGTPGWTTRTVATADGRFLSARRPDAVWVAPLYGDCRSTRYAVDDTDVSVWPPKRPGTARCATTHGRPGQSAWALGRTLNGIPRLLHHDGAAWSYWNLPFHVWDLVRHPVTHELGAIRDAGWWSLDRLTDTPAPASPTVTGAFPYDLPRTAGLAWPSGSAVIDWDGATFHARQLPISAWETPEAVTIDADGRRWALAHGGLLTRAPVP